MEELGILCLILLLTKLQLDYNTEFEQVFDKFAPDVKT